MKAVSQFVRYGLVGGLATAAHYLLLVLGVEGFGWPAAWASGAGALLGAQLAFVGNRRLTFAHKGPWWPAWWRFQGTAVLGALVGMGVVAGGLALGVHYLLAQVLATGLVLVLTFLVNRAWAFRPPRPGPG